MKSDSLVAVLAVAGTTVALPSTLPGSTRRELSSESIPLANIEFRAPHEPSQKSPTTESTSERTIVEVELKDSP